MARLHPRVLVYFAVVAQLVEHLVANEKVTGSDPVYCLRSQVPKVDLSGIKVPDFYVLCVNSSIGGAPPFQGDCCGFESRLTLSFAPITGLVF